MSAPKIMAIRMGIYSLLIGYLLLDLFVFKGPLKKTLTEPQLDTEATIAEDKAQGIVARVYHEPIFRKQIEERMKEYLWRRGRTINATSIGERKMLRRVILDEMIDELLVKIQVKVSPIENFAVDPAELETAVFTEGMRLGEAFDELAKRSGWQGEDELQMRLGARMQRENYLKSMIHADVSEAEALAWYEEHQEAMKTPELRRIKWHLGGGEGIEEEWIEASKLPEEIAVGVFKMAENSKGDFGNYKIELLEIQASRQQTFEEAKESIIEALTTYRRDEAWKKFRYGRLRYRARGNEVNKEKIRIFEENLVEAGVGE